jgi:hypothetical protein
MRVGTTFALLALCAPTSGGGAAPEESPGTALRLVVEPGALELEVGERAGLQVRVLDASGDPVKRSVVFYSRAPRDVAVTADGEVSAHGPGRHVVVAVVPTDPRDDQDEPEGVTQVEVPIEVPLPPLRELRFVGVPARVYSGTELPLQVEGRDASGALRPEVRPRFESGDPEVARVDATGRVSLLSPGTARLEARAEGVEGLLELEVLEDPVHALELESSAEGARTGDLVRFRAVARDSAGNVVPDYPVLYAASARPDPRTRAPGASSLIGPGGDFVAERSGVHTVVAVAGPRAVTRTLTVSERSARQRLSLAGRGVVRDRHTSDLWVWEGPDGRDYAITGTWGADGRAYVWDVTDPHAPRIADVVQVDARTVNDVKVSGDGRLAVISREGASNRRNGFVLLDVSSPLEGVKIVGHFDDQLRGGVHNVFVWERHVFAVSNGRRFDIVDVADPARPVRVGRFELATRGHSLHDVWVHDGVAYTSNWADGVVAVDVGGGGQGGSLRAPEQIGSYAWPSGWSHAAFPYLSRSTGRRYVFAGDESFPYGMHPEKGSPPERAGGWIHVIDVEDWERPREVARYAVPEAGSHNLWVEDDVLYVGYYNGGVRVVDVSGELRGDLYRQGREIAAFLTYDPEGYLANAPFVWGVQPHKGHVFASDFNSGLWVLKLEPYGEDEAAPDPGEPQ